MKEKVNYLIIGQGITGTWLSYFLEKNNQTFKVINSSEKAAATSVASGVINPVTGRRIVQTWIIDEVLPFAVSSYQSLQEQLGIPIIQKSPIVVIHPSSQMKESFDYRLAHENIYLKTNDARDWNENFNTPFGTGEIDECYWIDLNLMLTEWRKELIAKQNYIDANSDLNDIIIHETSVEWNGILADKIIFCEGIHSMSNPYFNTLPFAPNKGEALIVKIPNLPNDHIYKSNLTIVPWKENLFWVGSNYEWNFESVEPSDAFKEKMITGLDALLKIPYTVIDHLVGIRPANTQRRPFVGFHPDNPRIGICNGMGTKGCSLAPYFAHQLVQHAINGTPLHPEADVNRFNLSTKNKL